MKRTSWNHGAEFKAKVAMAAQKGDKSLTKLMEHCGIHPTQITDGKLRKLLSWQRNRGFDPYPLRQYSGGCVSGSESYRSDASSSVTGSVTSFRRI